MSAGVPVIATQTGGAADVVDDATGFAIGWDPVDGRAKPRLPDAAHAIRSVFVDPDEAARRAGTAMRRLRRERTLARAAAFLRDQLS